MPRPSLAYTVAPFLLICLSRPAPAQSAPRTAEARNSCVPDRLWRAIVTEGKEKSQVMQILDHLVNRIGPRLTSSDNCTTACEWARDWLQGIGIDNARLEEWGTFPVGFNRGPWSGEILAPAESRKTLEFVTMAWTAGTRGRQKGGLARAPKNMREARERADELRGNWLLAGNAGGSFRLLATPNLKLHRFLDEVGALGIVRPSRSSLLVTGGSWRISFDRLPRLPVITLRQDQHAELEKLLADGREVELAFDIRNYFKRGPIPLFNVIADIRGTEKPDEYVVVGGHIDSWDGATGATDNGTGTATTLEAARILTACGVEPRRTIRFMLWSGEEQGLMGSRNWCQRNRKLVREHVSACLVHDGGTGTVIGLQGFPQQLPLLQKAFAGFATIDERFPFEVGEATGVMPGSDHFSFHQIGAPGFFWLQDPAVNYTHTHHTQHDTYDSARQDMQKQTATVVALGALAIANLDDLLPRPPKGAGISMTMPISIVGIRLSRDMEVTKVQKNSHGERLGLRKGDKLLRFNGRKMRGGEQGFMRQMVAWAMSGAATGKLVLIRDGKEIELTVPNPMAAR